MRGLDGARLPRAGVTALVMNGYDHDLIGSQPEIDGIGKPPHYALAKLAVHLGERLRALLDGCHRRVNRSCKFHAETGNLLLIPASRLARFRPSRWAKNDARRHSPRS